MNEYKDVDLEEYYLSFGLKKKTNGGYEVDKKKKLRAAYDRAWNNRDFEISKYWSRAAYFWGFIVLIFGGYISIVTGDRYEEISTLYLDLLFLVLGYHFSLTWYLVILGSKRWQMNWENHIDMLEEYVSGPLYRTIYNSKKRVYSVSKLNEVLALIVVFTWVILLLQFYIMRYSLCLKSIEWIPTLAIIALLVLSGILIFGYPSKQYNSTSKGWIKRKSLDHT